jgi:Xaa-Pro aminopeptidase
MLNREALEPVWEGLREAGADALLVTHPANVRYLSGFSSPEDGRVLLSEKGAQLWTDGRYIQQANEESRLEVVITDTGSTWAAQLSAYVKEVLGGPKLAFEAESTPYALFAELREGLGSEPVPTKGLVSGLRLVKTPAELETLREAARLTDEAFSHILNILQPGLTEVEVALELERFIRLQGADGVSFPIIVASGMRSAMPHGVASSKRLARGELVTLDFGAKVAGYHADMTRTVALGELCEAHERLYNAVLEAQEAALAALAPGREGRAVDAVARDALAAAGLAGGFTHGLGHGVGLEVHEGPRLSRLSKDTLRPGMVVTVEPGVYYPGDAGVRIEDLTVVTEGGCERLSKSPKALIRL